MSNPFPAQLHEAAMGLHYLHERRIVHGDLKGVCPLSSISFYAYDLQDNILIADGPVRACLADFGLSTLAPSPLGETSTITTGGTYRYMSPELLDPGDIEGKSARPTQPADIYALGMVIYEVLTGSDPFHDYNMGAFQLMLLVMKGGRPKKPSNAEEIGFGSGTWELVKECWRDQSTGRPTIERVLGHLARNSAGECGRLENSSLRMSPHGHELVLPVEPIILQQSQHLASQDPGSTNRQQIATSVGDAGNQDKISIVSRWLRNFRRFTKPQPDSTSRSAEEALPHPPDDFPEAPGDNNPIVSQWRQLASTNTRSPDFRPLLLSLTSEVGRSLTTALCGDDAGDTLGIMDKVGSACDGTRRCRSIPI